MKITITQSAFDITGRESLSFRSTGRRGRAVLQPSESDLLRLRVGCRTSPKLKRKACTFRAQKRQPEAVQLTEVTSGIFGLPLAASGRTPAYKSLGATADLHRARSRKKAPLMPSPADRNRTLLPAKIVPAASSPARRVNYCAVLRLSAARLVTHQARCGTVAVTAERFPVGQVSEAKVNHDSRRPPAELCAVDRPGAPAVVVRSAGAAGEPSRRDTYGRERPHRRG